MIIILPNQLFEDPFYIKDKKIKIYLYEHPKFFTKYKYHKLKLIYHRATMKCYYDYLLSKNLNVSYIEFHEKINYTNHLKIYDPVDFDILNEFKKKVKNIEIFESKLFLLTRDDLKEFSEKNKFIHHYFYKWIRLKYNILIKDNKPVGGKWSYDIENRNNFEKNFKEKKITYYENNYIKEAQKYILKHFSKNIGDINVYLPIDFKSSKKSLHYFIKYHLKNYGKYQDAVKSDIHFGYHSVLSPMINNGLLDVKYIIKKVTSIKNKIPIASLEGYLRQLLSWREYVRMLYVLKYDVFLSNNFFKHKKKINEEWYNGTTNIKPIDDIIHKVLKISYCHHIERLMFLGNFMLLCQFDPKEIYKWFISVVSIDAYEWVMIPNIYGMSQFSVGNLMMTRPYFSSSNYIIKMSDYKKKSGNQILINKEIFYWSDIWNILYYYFIYNNRKYLSKNYSTANAVYNWNKKSTKEKKKIIKIGYLFINNKY